MQMRVERLRETLKLLQPVIPKKTTLPITTNVLLKDGKAIATDLETVAIVDLPEAEGECLLPHRRVFELLKYVAGYEMLTMAADKSTLRLSWDGGQASYVVADVKDYPPVPEVKWSGEASVDGDVLVKTLSSMSPYCARDNNRPVLAGVSLLLGENTAVAAGDGFRMAYQDLSIPFPVEHSAIIPTNAIHTLASFWDKAPATAPLAGDLISQITSKRNFMLSLGETKTGNSALSFRFGRTTLIVKLIEGNPPNFKALIPETTRKVQVMGPDLERAVLRLRNIAKDGSGIVRLKWGDSSMSVSARSKEMGESEATIPANALDGPGRIAFEGKYLAEYLDGKDGMVTIGVVDEHSSSVWTYRGFPTVLIMPMFVQWDGESQAKADETADEAGTETGEEEGVVLPESIADDGSIAIANAPTPGQPNEAPAETPQVPKPRRGRKKKG